MKTQQTFLESADAISDGIAEMQADIDRLKAINAELRDALCTAAIGAIAIDPSAHSDLEAALYAQSQYVRGICHAALAKAQQS